MGEKNKKNASSVDSKKKPRPIPIKSIASGPISDWRSFKPMQNASNKLPSPSNGKLIRKLLKKSSGRHYYKHPVEKLVRRLKEERIEDIHEDLNIHRHQVRRQSFIGGRGMKKEVEIIQKILKKHGRKSQPKLGWEYNKRQKRLLLGYRHRKLERGCRYFEPIKDFFPRHLKPNNHIPDGIFYFTNIMLFMTTGIFDGIGHASAALNYILEDSVEYEAFKVNQTVTDYLGHRYWRDNAPFEFYGDILLIDVLIIRVVIFLGFLGMYLADLRLHAFYTLCMLLCLSVQGVVTIIVQQKNYCLKLMDKMGPLLKMFVENYYETIEAFDNNGNLIYWDNANNIETVKIRTYKAANLMDRIQTNLHCCGVDGFQDYLQLEVTVPPSCCTPLWNLHPYCAKVIPFDVTEFKAKFSQNEQGGCKDRLATICKNLHRMFSATGGYVTDAQLALFGLSCVAIIMQIRQIRQLRRAPHLRISAGSISQSLTAQTGNERGGGAVKMLEVASKMTVKQTDHLQQMRQESGLARQKIEEDTSTSSSSEHPVHTVNFNDMKNLHAFLESEDKSHGEKMDLDKTVEGFAGRFNIVANKSLQNYVAGIFSSTFQNETNAALEAINQTLDRQFAQHTTDYDWRKLLKPTQKKREIKTMTIAERRIALLEQMNNDKAKGPQPPRVEVKRVPNPAQRGERGTRDTIN